MKSAALAALLATQTDARKSVSPDGKCRILALRSGGTHGAFEVGVLSAFVDHLVKIDIHWDFLSGVSIGAINASAFSLYDYGREREAINDIKKIYTEHDMTELWEAWPAVIFEPLWKKSFVKNDGLRNIIAEFFGDRPFKRKLSVEAVDLVTGQVVIFDDEVMKGDVRNEMIVSSASIPAMFPPVHLDDMWLADGGVF